MGSAEMMQQLTGFGFSESGDGISQQQDDSSSTGQHGQTGTIVQAATSAAQKSVHQECTASANTKTPRTIQKVYGSRSGIQV